MEAHSANMQRLYEAKLKEEIQAIQRNIDSRFERLKLKKDTHTNDGQSVAAAITATSNQMSMQQMVKREIESMKNQLIDEVKQATSLQIKVVQNDINQEMRNLYKVTNDGSCIDRSINES